MSTTIPGVGPDAPTETNAVGASQSASPYRLDLIPPRSLLDVAAVLALGATKYGVDNWRGIPTTDHINHALVHIYAYLSGDTQDNHLGHATCRMMMAHETKLKEGQKTTTAEPRNEALLLRRSEADYYCSKCGTSYRSISKGVTNCSNCLAYFTF